MAVYDQLPAFMALVKAANPTFERWLPSQLRPVIELLKSPTGAPAQVQAALARITPDRVTKYRDALWFLQATYPGLQRQRLSMTGVLKSNAAMYSRTLMTAAYAPDARPPVRIRPHSQFMGMPIEQVMLIIGGPVGIVLIHLSTFEKNMSDVIDGRMVVDHMNSVLRIGALCGADLLCLHIAARPVCDELELQAGAFGGRRTNLFVKDGHMGGHDARFRHFAEWHQHVVVMGFDANICVNANLFGAPEHLPDGQFVPPLISMTNVVTSRAVLVTDGAIFPPSGQGEYGVLNGQ